MKKGEEAGGGGGVYGQGGMTARSVTLFLNKVFHRSCHFALNPFDTSMQYKRDHTASPADFDQELPGLSERSEAS